VEVLRQHCERYRPRFFFCSSVLHSPTSTHLAPHTAYQILRLAEEFDLTIVEDDAYSELVPVSANVPVTRLASLDQLQRVIYIGSFSKTVVPGLRVGYVCADARLIEWLKVYKTVSSIAGASVNQRALYQLLTRGSYRHHCAQLRARLDECRQPVMDQLEAMGCAFEYRPDMGMYVWAALPSGANATSIADAMYRQAHLMAPGSFFMSRTGGFQRCGSTSAVRLTVRRCQSWPNTCTAEFGTLCSRPAFYLRLPSRCTAFDGEKQTARVRLYYR
jgi:DNA-binding transcriptional MocR family regulator